MISGSIAAAAVMMILSVISSFASNGLQLSEQERMLRMQQDFNSEEAEKNRIFYSAPEEFDRMTTDLGFNPDLAAQAVMGVQGSSGYAAQSPTAPQVPNLTGALSGLLGGMPSTILDALQQPATIEHLQSETNRNNIDSDWIPITRQAQVDFWNAQSAESLSKVPMYGNLSRLYSEQADWVAPLSQAECLQLRSEFVKNMEQAVLAFQEAITQGTLRDMYDAYSREADSQALLNGQLKEESEARERWYDNLANTEFYKGLQEFYDANLREKMSGLPISPDLAFNLFVLKALGNEDEQKMADDVFQSVLNGCRDLKDMEYEVNYQNRVEHLWGNFGLDVLGSVPNLVPNFYVPIQGVGRSPKGRSSKSKPSSSVSEQKKPWNPQDRYDRYGNHWVNGRIVDD